MWVITGVLYFEFRGSLQDSHHSYYLMLLFTRVIFFTDVQFTTSVRGQLVTLSRATSRLRIPAAVHTCNVLRFCKTLWDETQATLSAAIYHTFFSNLILPLKEINYAILILYRKSDAYVIVWLHYIQRFDQQNLRSSSGKTTNTTFKP